MKEIKFNELKAKDKLGYILWIFMHLAIVVVGVWLGIYISLYFVGN